MPITPWILVKGALIGTAGAAGSALGPWGGVAAAALTGGLLNQLGGACAGSATEGIQHLPHAIPHAVDDKAYEVVGCIQEGVKRVLENLPGINC